MKEHTLEYKTWVLSLSYSNISHPETQQLQSVRNVGFKREFVARKEIFKGSDLFLGHKHFLKGRDWTARKFKTFRMWKQCEMYYFSFVLWHCFYSMN